MMLREAPVKAGLRGQPRAAAVTLMAAIPLPAALEQLGCDEATWSEIRGKEAFVKLLEAGDEAGAKERLDSVKAAVDKKGAPKAAPKAAKEGSIPLPAALEQMGCDEALWSKIRAKAAFVKLLEAGDEAGAKERLEKLRNAPSITGVEMEMPAVLASWGCDEALW